MVASLIDRQVACSKWNLHYHSQILIITNLGCTVTYIVTSSTTYVCSFTNYVIAYLISSAEDWIYHSQHAVNILKLR